MINRKMSMASMYTAIAVVALAAMASGCASGVHPASPLSPEQKRAFAPHDVPSAVPEVPGMTSLGGRGHIAAPPEKVWNIVAVNFGKIETWGGAGVAASSGTPQGGLGATRHCKIADHMPVIGGSTYDETIIAWDEQRRYYAFEQTMASGPTDKLVGETWIDSDGRGGSVVTTVAHFAMSFPASMMSGMAASKFKRQFLAALAGLKHYAETGEKVTVTNWEAVADMYPRLREENEL